ncbi:hypothetical protein CPTB_01655 [Corynebacterium pseudotuberculosis]|nr:hypothetical protein CPTB_01655 [Corynebacterium pseudotuberculosis]AIG12391.1 hypothetical protein CPTC_02103 [Corynebacterium pseudotuberculosis]
MCFDRRLLTGVFWLLRKPQDGLAADSFCHGSVGNPKDLAD